MFPQALRDVGIDVEMCTITDDAALCIQSKLGNLVRTKGLRCIEQELHNISSRINMIRSQYRTDGRTSDIQLSYSLPDFKGFPYNITRNTIDKLFVGQEDDFPWHIYG